MVNHKLFFAICLTTLLYIGCPSQAVEEKSKLGGPQTNIIAASESGNLNDSTISSTTPSTPMTKPQPPKSTSPGPTSTTAASTTTSPHPNTTTAAPTPKPSPSPTPAPTSTAAPTPSPHDRSFDLPSFIGGVILSLGMAAIGYVVFKFYKTRTDPNYRTL